MRTVPDHSRGRAGSRLTRDLQGPKSKNSNAEINSTTNWKPNDAHSAAVIHSYLLAKTRSWSR